VTVRHRKDALASLRSGSRRKPLDDGERIEGGGGCADAPMSLEAAVDAAVWRELEALRRDRRPSHTTTDVFEPLEFAGGYEHLGVQGERSGPFS
jgi:hypothetical protein